MGYTVGRTIAANKENFLMYLVPVLDFILTLSHPPIVSLSFFSTLWSTNPV